MCWCERSDIDGFVGGFDGLREDTCDSFAYRAKGSSTERLIPVVINRCGVGLEVEANEGVFDCLICNVVLALFHCIMNFGSRYDTYPIVEWTI